MNKKTTIIFITFQILTLLLVGCFEKSNNINLNKNPSIYYYPIGKISSPEWAYYGDAIELDASDSYDPDGKIVSYKWDFGDYKTIEGAIVRHTYNFENDFTIDYPLVFTINLFLEDNDGYKTAINKQIKIYPKMFKLYFSPNSLVFEKPELNYEQFKTNGILMIGSPAEIIFNLDNHITVKKCIWNTTIYLEKQLFTLINKISIILYDFEGNEIIKKDEFIRFNNIWMKKAIIINGLIEEEEKIKTVKIVISGISFRKTTKIVYGGENPSFICFDFSKYY